MITKPVPIGTGHGGPIGPTDRMETIMAFKIMHDVATADLLPGDVVIRNDDDSVLQLPVPDTGEEYVTLTWCERIGGSITWETSAQPWNTWPIVVREA